MIYIKQNQHSIINIVWRWAARHSG